MKKTLKWILKKLSLYYPIYNYLNRRRWEKELIEWEEAGRPVPPPHIFKQKKLLEYARKCDLKVLVETGTYFGDMINALKSEFEEIYSIELSEKFYQQARVRFKRLKHIKLIQGDSKEKFPELIGGLDRPALFWLDAHYSGGNTAKGDRDTPVYEELAAIFKAEDRGHVILIDDVHSFESGTDYGSVEELLEYIKSRRPGVDIAVEDNMVVVIPGE